MSGELLFLLGMLIGVALGGVLSAWALLLAAIRAQTTKRRPAPHEQQNGGHVNV